MKSQFYSKEIRSIAESEGLTGAIKAELISNDLFLVTEDKNNPNSMLLRRHGKTFIPVGCFLGNTVSSRSEKSRRRPQSQRNFLDFLLLKNSYNINTYTWLDELQNSIDISYNKDFFTLTYMTLLIGIILSLHFN